MKRNYFDLFLAAAHRFLDRIVCEPINFHHNPKGGINQDKTFARRQCPDLFASTLANGAHGDDQGNDYFEKQEELLLYSTLAPGGHLVDLFPLGEFGLGFVLLSV